MQKRRRGSPTLYPTCSGETSCVFIQNRYFWRKPYEEFFGEDDVVDWETFEALGAIKTNETRKAVDVHYLLNDVSQLFHEKTTTKASIITFLDRHIPEFNYIDKGKSLDQKM